MESTWERRELPVLRALVEYFDDVDAYRLQPGQIGELSGLSEDEVKRALKALWEVDEPFLVGIMSSGRRTPCWCRG